MEDWDIDEGDAVKFCGCFSSILTAEILREFGIWGCDDGFFVGVAVMEGIRVKVVVVDERKEEE